jgi:outer membrane protein
LSLQYYFNNSSIFTPYVGGGLNYTKFWDEDAGSSLNTTLGGNVSLDLDNSWGLAAEAGVDVNVGNNWLLNAAIWYIDIDTNATYTVRNGALAGARVKSDVNLDPWVYMASVGYKF